MKVSFNNEKNELLKKVRKIDFETIIQNGKIIEDVRHKNKKKYPSQRMLLIEFNNYIYIVPYIEEEDGSLFLKTIIPSRKYTKQYLKVDNTL